MKGRLWNAGYRCVRSGRKLIDAVHDALVACNLTYMMAWAVQPYIVYTLRTERQVEETDQSGFTIVETLIVLVVTGSLFIGAATLIGGRQNRTQFSQAARTVQAEIQQAIDEVSAGYYQSTLEIKCEALATGPQLTTAATPQGTNKDCIFLGKVLQFGVHNTDPQVYNIYTLAGLRGTEINPVLSLLSAKPRVIARSASEAATQIPDVFDAKKL